MPPEVGAASVDQEPDPEQVARAIALRMLTRAARSRQQLGQAMARKDVPQDVAERVLDRFADVGLVDDAAFAGQLVRSQHDSRALARRALAAELRRRGVADDDAREAPAQVTEQDEEAAARALVERRWRDDLDQAVQSRRLLAMLGRKGYPPGMAARVVRQMVDDRGARSGHDRWEPEPDPD